jgi:hypothetical protein
MNEHLITMINSNSDKFNSIYILSAFYYLNYSAINESNNNNNNNNYYLNDLPSDNYMEKCLSLKLNNTKILSKK